MVVQNRLVNDKKLQWLDAQYSKIKNQDARNTNRINLRQSIQVKSLKTKVALELVDLRETHEKQKDNQEDMHLSQKRDLENVVSVHQ